MRVWQAISSTHMSTNISTRRNKLRVCKVNFIFRSNELKLLLTLFEIEQVCSLWEHMICDEEKACQLLFSLVLFDMAYFDSDAWGCLENLEACVILHGRQGFKRGLSEFFLHVTLKNNTKTSEAQGMWTVNYKWSYCYSLWIGLFSDKGWLPVLY